jgi:hypothetical protein
MTSVQGQVPADIGAAAQLEDRLASVLGEMVDDVQHMEWFDVEQRAEIYTILKALQADTEMHRDLINALARQTGKYVSDA